jgi:hypothetical protein
MVLSQREQRILVDVESEFAGEDPYLASHLAAFTAPQGSTQWRTGAPEIDARWRWALVAVVLLIGIAVITPIAVG